jgi:uncharacterized membrane protein YhaH (DUF805 family)
MRRLIPSGRRFSMEEIRKKAAPEAAGMRFSLSQSIGCHGLAILCGFSSAIGQTRHGACIAMGMFKAVGSVYANMFNFSGRARRAEYWWYALFIFLMSILLQAALVFWLIRTVGSDPAAIQSAMKHYEDDIATWSLWFGAGYFIFVFIPQLAVTVRRLHDTGRSGWWMFKPFLVSFAIGFVGTFLAVFLGGGTASPAIMLLVATASLGCMIWFIVVLCLPGIYGNNRFGPDPIPNRKRPAREAGHPALVKEMDEELGRQVAAQRKAEFENYYRARVVPAIERNKSMRRT